MLQKLTIRNFQAHEQIVVDFDPHLSVITGQSDVGKSSIIRALQWICTNSPGGESFIRHGADSAKVALEVDGKLIVRMRGGGNNSYRLSKQEYKSFGQSVPQPIADVLNIGDVNFQSQHDAPWWFSNSAGEVSRNINAIINLGVIDGTLAHLNSALRKAQECITITIERLTAAEADRESLKGVRDQDADLTKVEIALATQDQASNAARLLRQTIEEALRHTQTAKNAAEATESGLAVLRKADEWTKIEQEGQSLQNLIDEIKEMNAKAELRPVGDLGPIKQAKTDWLEARMAMNDLRGILFDYQNKEQLTRQADAALSLVKKKLSTYSGNICPTCKRPLTN